MAKYRIVKRWDQRYRCFDYLIQKKILGFYWWTVDVSSYPETAEYRVERYLEPKVPDEVIAEYGT